MIWFSAIPLGIWANRRAPAGVDRVLRLRRPQLAPHALAAAHAVAGAGDDDVAAAGAAVDPVAPGARR